MTRKSNNLPADLRGAASLTIDAIVGITDIVESLHYTIAGGPKMPDKSARKRLQGIPGTVYRNVRRITRLAGGVIDLLLEQLSLLLGEQESVGGREVTLAIINGVLGDYLAARNNSLAIPMQLRRHGIALDEEALAVAIQQGNGRVVVMVHGLCMNDQQLNRQGHDHGEALARDLGLTPVYVRYNSGLHVSENGRELAELMETIVDLSAQPTELTIIGYSMGGLVARSACYYGEILGYGWPAHLRKLLIIGAPNHGAHLERGGNWIDVIMGLSAYSAPFSRLGKIRSSGFTDLRYGNVVDEDWAGYERFELAGDQRICVPLPTGVSCYAIAASMSRNSNKLGDDLIGDGLVTVNSALGRHNNPAMDLQFPEGHKWVGRNMRHLDLLNHPQVYETIKIFLS